MAKTKLRIALEDGDHGSFAAGDALAPDLAIISATTEELLAEAANGRMFVLVGNRDGSGGAALVQPAQMTTPESVNFMAKQARGLISLALPAGRIEALGLSTMGEGSGDEERTHYTVSIEARDGVTTGISAADRAHTIAVAVNTVNPDAIVTPGHVFPISVREGGVLVRSGFAEAGVDISRLAGLNPSATICHIMNMTGDVATGVDVAAMAQEHGLKVGSIGDLIAYRRRYDHLVSYRGQTELDSEHGGTWSMKVYLNKVDGSEHIVLQKGEITSPTLVRVHVLSAFMDVLAERSAAGNQLHRAMDVIGERGCGVIVALRDIVSTPLSEMVERHRERLSMEIKDYGIGAQILADLGVAEMEMLSNSNRSYVALEGYGLTISKITPF
ncbi:MAG: 3,4-dihydroxy-2-butanone-4-phosphate synthase [Sphingobium sp.]|jgi:3,4-dihydroxy 2-butanone 4-phosphate synthase/GTP cyclohydrolase II|nr:3,4-dihydroxy-2-butanone-4-phosphate synthase [Sphingobium sp.]MCI1270782.1 3,4-dihydroxy-2-butanone-4-phosphate synthase [Sphingobium sp.]MCI1756394.1 3,4-dihydroxy-2-butanone-4-phosphate synthase [Sphingobium sp.]MCI2051911.1 3,4-dihydroxy-2-butanone-4-phosphate synthase [Sphingobium sp.]